MKLCYDIVEVKIARIKLGDIWYTAQYVKSKLDLLTKDVDRNPTIDEFEDEVLLDYFVKNKIVTLAFFDIFIHYGYQPDNAPYSIEYFDEFRKEVDNICKLDEDINIMDYPEDEEWEEEEEDE